MIQRNWPGSWLNLSVTWCRSLSKRTLIRNIRRLVIFSVSTYSLLFLCSSFGWYDDPVFWLLYFYCLLQGAARVVFASREAYISAVARRVICFKTLDGQKEASVLCFLVWFSVAARIRECFSTLSCNLCLADVSDGDEAVPGRELQMWPLRTTVEAFLCGIALLEVSFCLESLFSIVYQSYFYDYRTYFT